MSELKIDVKNVSKIYRKYKSEFQRFLSWFGLAGNAGEKLKILDDISFSVMEGEAVALVGENGAGKSTLLKIITGTVQSTHGNIAVNGRVSAILELGLGFNPEMTGRQNVFLSAGVMGFREKEIHQLVEGIAEFSELGKYFDEPVRTYSSGMNVRLAFAIATAVRPEILIVDEALSVGDSYFQFKCMNRIRRFLSDGTTLLLVSHDLSAIKAMCDRAILIDGGRVIHDGDVVSVTDLYQSLMLKKQNELQIESQRGKNGVTVQKANGDNAEKLSTTLVAEDILHHVVMELLDESGRPVSHLVTGSELTVRIKVSFKQSLEDPHVGFGIRNKDGLTIYESNTYCLGYKPGRVDSMEELCVEFSFKCHLGEGDFSFVLGVADGGYDRGSFNEIIYFEQDYKVIKILCSDNDTWSGFFNLQPIIKSGSVL
ncbi:MAG: lipopolysaccharide transport system ATP-binding protein [Phenylobacterium sp.]|jgi:lipopolysaccharide transport system ATP-binding protein